MKCTAASLLKKGGRPYQEDHLGHIIVESEDADLVHPMECWALADGLGGHGGGHIASEIAVQHLLTSFEERPSMDESVIKQYINQANQLIIERQHEAFELSNMRTTIVVLITNGTEARWAHIGDSRLYHFLNGRLSTRTRDHSVPEAMARAGDIREHEIRFHEDRNRLLRTLGHAEDYRDPTLSPTPIAISTDDAFLLCTDGFWEYVTETEMEVDFAKAQSPEHWLELMELRLFHRVEPKNDNYSATAIFIEP